MNKAIFLKADKNEIVAEILALLPSKCCDMECWPTLSKPATLLLFGNQDCLLTTEKLLLHNYDCGAKLMQHLIEDPYQVVPSDLLTFLVTKWFPENNNNFMNLLVLAVQSPPTSPHPTTGVPQCPPTPHPHANTTHPLLQQGMHIICQKGHTNIYHHSITKMSSSLIRKIMNVPQIDGSTPLHSAALITHDSHTQCCQVPDKIDIILDLLHRGANPSSKNDQGKTRLQSFRHCCAAGKTM